MPKLTLCFKGQFIEVHNLASPRATVGRAADADIHIESLAIAPLHAVIEWKGEQCRLVPIDDNPISVNLQPVIAPTILAHGDSIQIGKHELFFAENAINLHRDIPHLKPAAAGEGRGGIHRDSFDRLVGNLDNLPLATIQVLSGSHVGKVIPLRRGLTRLGLTGNECAMVAHRDDGYYIAHLEGEIPPRVNNCSIGNRSVRLESGQEILLGRIRMRFYEEIEQSAAM